ncbi:golgin subfamily A member 1 isoform X4 [Carettochelys insculpta]|uniref:golgin subfamily A member 1 isoform X4 n=1 Tax=Carettochelys insculpta TaxID=44489 RepID=UPI003EBEA0DB
MFAKLKKKIAEEAAIAPRPGGAARIPRSISKESVTSVGADSGDDFASDGSSSREDLSSQLLRRNEQIRKLEAKLSDYADQVRNLQKIKEKLEIALEKHQDSSMKKFQEQNEVYQANRAKMAEGMALALEKKDQEWREKLVHLEKEKQMLATQLQEMREQSLNLFQKRDEIDELEGFQQQELAKVKHMLLKKEESLSRAEQALEACSQELTHTKEELQATSHLSSLLSRELQELRQQHSELVAERDELVTAEVNTENKITALEQRGQELQTFIQRLSADLQNQMTVEADEKNKLIEHLQEKVSSLEKRLEGNFSGDEHVQELLKEVTKLNSQVAAAQASLCEREEFLKSFTESNMCQRKELEQALQLAKGALERSRAEISARELQIQNLQTDLEVESNKLQQHISTVKHQCAERISRLEAQIAALETAREFDKTTSQHKISQLKQENEDLIESRKEFESSLKKQEFELERLKKELISRETVSVEIAKALEEAQKQREELQQQVADLILLIKEKDQLISEKTDVLLKKEEKLNQLSQDRAALTLQVHLLQSDIDTCKRQAAERTGTAGKQISALSLKIQEHQEHLLASDKNVLALEAARALNKHLHDPEDREVEQNGEVATADIIQLQKDNRELEKQISEKNKMIKQLQQRMAELKKTLQKELKIRPENEIPDVREVPNPALTVTNNSDLNDSREINFEYLKHVVLKFMSCRESEAFHLIKAVSVLLNFSQEEENMLKETLEYKMSWFGSKPSPKGSIRPSISNPRTAWS